MKICHTRVHLWNKILKSQINKPSEFEQNWLPSKMTIFKIKLYQEKGKLCPASPASKPWIATRLSPNRNITPLLYNSPLKKEIRRGFRHPYNIDRQDQLEVQGNRDISSSSPFPHLFLSFFLKILLSFFFFFFKSHFPFVLGVIPPIPLQLPR